MKRCAKIIAEPSILNFILLCLANLIIIWATQNFIISDELYFTSLSEKLSDNSIQNIINQTHKWGWLSYAVTPIILFIKVFLVSICLGIGCFFVFNEMNIIKLIRISIYSESLFLVSAVIKFFWLVIHEEPLTIDYISKFSPLSIINLTDTKVIEPYLVYPLQTVNLFELIYVLSLAYGIHKEFNISYKKSLNIVFFSYVTGLILWVASMSLLTLIYS